MDTKKEQTQALAPRNEAQSPQTAMTLPADLTTYLTQVQTILQVQSGQISRLEEMLREMVTLTTAQEGTIKRAALARAKELCAKYGMDNALQRKVASAIRADITKPSGVRAVRDIPRSEYKIALEQTETWEKAGLLRRMAREATAEGGNDGKV